MRKNTLKISHIQYSMIGGAGIAAKRLHEALLAENVDSKLYSPKINSQKNYSDMHLEEIYIHDDWKLHEYLNNNIHESNTIFSYPTQGVSKNELDAMVAMYDIINIHWIARLLSLENIAYLSHQHTPLVWTMHDMNIISGGCHYFHGCERWKKDCSSCPQLKDTLKDLPAKVLDAKKKHFNFENITLVVLSTHSKHIAEQSIFKHSRIEVIPNSLDINIFAPKDKVQLRQKMQLPMDKKILFFLPSFESTVKGGKELYATVKLLQEKKGKYFLLQAGASDNQCNSSGFESRSLGYIRDAELLAEAYAVADVTIVPSLEETFSNTTAESISSGTPVVGFKVGGIPDMVIDGKTGYTVEVGDCEGLALAIEKVLDGPDLSASCRAHAEQHFTFELQATRYKTLYLDLIRNKQRTHKQFTNKDIPDVFPELKDSMLSMYSKVIFETMTNLANKYKAGESPQAVIKYLEHRLHNTEQNPYYKFGTFSKIRKIITIVRFITKKLKIYPLIRPAEIVLKKILRR